MQFGCGSTKVTDWHCCIFSLAVRAHFKGVHMGRCLTGLLEGVCAFGIPVLPCLQMECEGTDRCQKNFEIAKVGLEHIIGTLVGRLIIEKKEKPKKTTHIFSRLVV